MGTFKLGHVTFQQRLISAACHVYIKCFWNNFLNLHEGGNELGSENMYHEWQLTYISFSSQNNLEIKILGLCLIRIPNFIFIYLFFLIECLLLLPLLLIYFSIQISVCRLRLEFEKNSSSSF